MDEDLVGRLAEILAEKNIDLYFWCGRKPQDCFFFQKSV